LLEVIGYALRLRGGVNYHPVGGAVISINIDHQDVDVG